MSLLLVGRRKNNVEKPPGTVRILGFYAGDKVGDHQVRLVNDVIGDVVTVLRQTIVKTAEDPIILGAVKNMRRGRGYLIYGSQEKIKVDSSARRG